MVAKILAACPQQCLSLEEYYRLVCPQVGPVLPAARQGIWNQLLAWGASVLSLLLERGLLEPG